MKTFFVVLALAAFAILLFGCIQAGKPADLGAAKGDTTGKSPAPTSSTSASLPPLELGEDELPVIEEPDFSFEGSDNAITMPEK